MILQVLFSARCLIQPRIPTILIILPQPSENALKPDKMEEYYRCPERWPDMKLNHDCVCARCIRVDSIGPNRRERITDPFLYSRENSRDPGALDHGLLPLAQIEEMLIARVHVFIEIRPGHFRARRFVVARWLEFLRQHHPGYRDIEVSTVNLYTLPEDAPVGDRLLVQELEAEMEQDHDNQDVTDVADEDEGGLAPSLITLGSRTKIGDVPAGNATDPASSEHWKASIIAGVKDHAWIGSLERGMDGGTPDVQNVDCRPEEQQSTRYQLEDGGETISAGQLPPQNPNCDLSTWTISSTSTSSGCTTSVAPQRRSKRRPFAEPRVLNYFPRHKQERLDIDDGFETFTEAWDYWNSTRPGTLSSDFMEELPPEPADDGLEDLNVDDNANVEGSSLKLPHRDDGVREEDPEGLGDCDCDRHYDRTPHRQLYDHLITHYQLELAGLQNKLLLVNLDGKTGTGKSHVIMLISATLEEMARCHGKASPVTRVASTGVAAPAISGRTLHVQVKLSVKFVKGYEALSIPNLTALQSGELRHVRDLIIDENSMIPPRILTWINQRFLATPCRWMPIESVAFRDALDALREDKVTIDDWRLLSSCVQALVPSEIPAFDDVSRIYGKKTRVAQWNHDRLRDLQAPIIIALASH
ncbi:hypothetical protein AYO20_11501 [Fonsecaea nubica]|uniref:ATP-dependent DNA helicase n=1 Tax=Fonsecaea nubica TaxID=856822 RepID=A0A178BRS5_9EURO|nr:hypothetical protein AYO20_11501 [Fonsecaea nubica]OAL20350.1 hypothetical protein AYO20_11501 [Fonsecaea nubica]